MNPFPFTRITLFALAALLVLTACGPKPQVPGKTDSAAVDPTKAAFDIKGEVVGLLPERKTLLVHHEEIPNYMPAMTMEFTIGSADFSVFKESQRITARMTQPEPGTFLLERIRILDAEKDRIAAAAAAELRQETLIRGKSAHREVGENAPRFTLYNQEGQLVPFDKFRGRRVVLNFIFTRCPVATMCPAATAKMAALQRLARDQGIKDVEFISITLDPEYDTPPVLKAYATTRGIDSSNFSFLTGPESAIRDLLLQFSVLAEPDENIFKHTLATLLIDRDGRIIHRIDGSQWSPDDLLARLR